MKDTYRFFGAFRLFLAFLVLGQHVHWIVPTAVGEAITSYSTGDIAVLTFFVLSGFVISEAAECFYKNRPMAFMSNRLLRILAPFLLAMIVSVLCTALIVACGALRVPNTIANGGIPGPDMFHARSLLANVLFIFPGIDKLAGTPTYLFIPITWALRTEMAFYLVFFVALLAGQRLRLQRLDKTLFGVGLVAIAAYLLWLKTGHPQVARYGPYFGLGVALYYCIGGRRLAFVLAAVFLGIVLYDFSIYGVPPGANRLAMTRIAVQYALLVACIGAVPLLALLEGSKRARRIDAYLGRLSYPFYLNHYTVIVILYSLLARSSVSAMFAAAAIALASAVIADRIVEPLMVPVRDRFRGRSLVEQRAEVETPA